MGEVICCVAAPVAPLGMEIRVGFAARGGGGAGGTREGMGADGRDDSVIVISLKQLQATRR